MAESEQDSELSSTLSGLSTNTVPPNDEEIIGDDLIPDTTSITNEESINTEDVSLSVSLSSKLSNTQSIINEQQQQINTDNDIELEEKKEAIIETVSTTTNSSFPSYEYEIEEGSVESLSSDSWPQQYPIDPIMIQNNQTLTDVMFNAFQNMVNAFGGFDYSNIGNVDNNDGVIDMDGNINIAGAHQNKRNRQCITFCILLIIILSVIGIILYSMKMELPTPPKIEAPPVVFDSADMLSEQYKPSKDICVGMIIYTIFYR